MLLLGFGLYEMALAGLCYRHSYTHSYDSSGRMEAGIINLETTLTSHVVHGSLISHAIE